MKSNPYIRSLTRIERHYARLLRHFGDTPEAAEWTSREARDLRFSILAEVGLTPEAKILDFGCGTGDLLDFLQSRVGFRGEYVGWDLSDCLLAAARAKFPDARFERREIISEGVSEDFDFVLASGTFNNDFGQAETFLFEALRLLFRHTRCAMAFNLLSKGAETFNPGLLYAEPEAIFRFCRGNLSPLVTLRHDYIVKPHLTPSDFAIYVYRQPGSRSSPQCRARVMQWQQA